MPPRSHPKTDTNELFTYMCRAYQERNITTEQRFLSSKTKHLSGISLPLSLQPTLSKKLKVACTRKVLMFGKE